MTTREVLLHYTADGTRRRGSGYRVGGRYIVTADHCARGTEYSAFVDGRESAAKVVWRSGDERVDIAVLEAVDFEPVTRVECRLLDRSQAIFVSDCVALGFPVWRDHRPPGEEPDSGQSPAAHGESRARVAQVPGEIPVREHVEPTAPPDHPAPATLRLRDTYPETRTVAGHLDEDPSWGGMSGAGVIVRDGETDILLGVIASWHRPAGSNSLTFIPFNALEALESVHRDALLERLGQPDWSGWRQVRAPQPVLAVSGAIPRVPPAFVERAVVDELWSMIAAPGAAAGVCPLADGRGLGKTQAAAAVARECVRDGWPVVWWVSASDPGTMIAELAALAAQLGLVSDTEEPERSLERLRSWLTTFGGRALLIFDDATDPDALRQVLPPSGCRTIITTVDRAFTSLGQQIPVGVFTPDEAQAYLIDRTGVDDPEGAARVAEALGRHPLGLAQAASTIRPSSGRPPLSYPDYLARLAATTVAAGFHRRPGEDYPDSLGQALQLNLDTALGLAADSDALLRFLGSVALLDVAGVDTAWLSQDLDNLLDEAGRASLLAWSDDGSVVTMHSLLGRFLRETAEPEQGGARIGQASSVLDAGRDCYDARAPLAERRLLVERINAHVDALAEAGAPYSLAHRLWLIGAFNDAALPANAIGLAHAVEDAARVLGPDHPDTLASRNNLAGAYESAGDLGQAIPLFEEALAGCRRGLSEGHPMTAAVAANLDWARAQAAGSGADPASSAR
ncbi:MAG: tetratricopeptide repeat protein [Actinomycetales bacterium]